MFGSPEIFPLLLWSIFLIAFRSKPGVPFPFSYAFKMRWQRQTGVGFCVNPKGKGLVKREEPLAFVNTRFIRV